MHGFDLCPNVIQANEAHLFAHFELLRKIQLKI